MNGKSSFFYMNKETRESLWEKPVMSIYKPPVELAESEYSSIPGARIHHDTPRALPEKGAIKSIAGLIEHMKSQKDG